MADGTKIEWTDATWTPVKGCTRVSPGCGGPGPYGGCYAEIMAARFSKPGQWGEGLAEIVTLPDGRKDHRWTGAVRFDEAELLKPLRWKRPRRIFVCSTADLFHEKVEDEWIDKVFAVMALCPQHTFQVLTKRPERMRSWFKRMDGAPQRWAADILADAAYKIGIDEDASVSVANWINGFSRWRHAPADDNPLDGSVVRWPLPNVWLGTSVEDQKRADERIPHLLATPAAVRWLSCEPLLGPVDLRWIAEPDEEKDGVIDSLLGCNWVDSSLMGRGEEFRPARPGHQDRVMRRWVCSPEADILANRKLNWIVAGGESGPGARPMHPDWARSLRDQCEAAGVPFLFKQWGEWLPIFEQPWNEISAHLDPAKQSPFQHVVWVGQDIDGGQWDRMNGCWDDSDSWYVAPNYQEPEQELARVGKKAAGRLLDGVQHDGFPQQGRGE